MISFPGLELAASIVTVTEALVLCPLLEDRGHITESIRILVPANRIKRKCFQITTSICATIHATLLQRVN